MKPDGADRPTLSTSAAAQVFEHIRKQALALGFSQIGVADVEWPGAAQGLRDWLDQGFHGDMAYMARDPDQRASPRSLRPGTQSVITVRMDYRPRARDAAASVRDRTDAGPEPADRWRAAEWQALHTPDRAVVSMYARGRDYHRVLRQRLARLAHEVDRLLGTQRARAFTDSAPVLEAELATRSGLGWRGKHTLVLDREAGSLFFLGEIFVDAWLPRTSPVDGHCGRCTACIDVCPTRAIVAPYRLDARRCISYLTIEHAGPYDEALRPLVGNRIYGCDDCQLICPWNKFAQRSTLPDFDERAGLHGQDLVRLMAWTEGDFLQRTEGSAIRRIGHARWLRNVATALGNALRGDAAGADGPLRGLAQPALQAHAMHADAGVREHVHWALAQAERTR